MKLAKRRASCTKCRGLCRNDIPRCAFGFAVGYKEINLPGFTASGKVSCVFPLEPCPRPRNYDEYIDAFIYSCDHSKERAAARKKIYDASE